MDEERVVMELIERWESKGGAHWVEIYDDGDNDYSYKSSSGGGYVGRDLTDLYRRIEEGYFQPDKNVTPMRRVWIGGRK